LIYPNASGAKRMKRVPVGILIAAIAMSLLAGGIAGFFLGVASTNAGAAFLTDLVEQEQQAETGRPKKMVRERFELRYPRNWKIDVDDEDYDPDTMFSIDSPGAAYVMFVLGDMETNPEDSLQEYIHSFSKLMDKPAVQPFETYGQIHGKGAILQGKLMGIKVIVKVFACYSQGVTANIVQQYPAEDLKYVENGLSLIEKSFILKPERKLNSPHKADAGDGL
jgi:hypothetical protein